MENLLVAIVTAVGLIVTQVIISHRQNNIVIYRIDQLEKKQDKHNGIMEKTYRLEEQVSQHDDWLSDLEKKAH